MYGKPIGHKTARSLFADYLTSSLDEPQRALVEQHVKDCAPCRDEFERFRKVFATLRQADIPSPPEQYFVNLLPRIRKRLESRTRPAVFPLPRWLAPVAAFGVALFLISRVDFAQPPDGLRALAGTLTPDELTEVLLVQARERTFATAEEDETIAGVVSETTVWRELFGTVLNEDNFVEYAPLEALPEFNEKELDMLLLRMKERSLL